MEQPTSMSPTFPNFQNKTATCKLPAGKGPWPALAPKPGRRTVWENRHTVAYLEDLRVNTDSPKPGSILQSCLIHSYRTCGLIPFCRHHRFHERGCPYASLAYSLAITDMSTRRFEGQSSLDAGGDRPGLPSLQSVHVPRLLGKVNMTSSGLVLTGWYDMHCAGPWST